MNIGEEIKRFKIQPARVPVPQRERTSPAKPVRRPAVAPKEAPGVPGAPERAPEKVPSR